MIDINRNKAQERLRKQRSEDLVEEFVLMEAAELRGSIHTTACKDRHLGTEVEPESNRGAAFTGVESSSLTARGIRQQEYDEDAFPFGFCSEPMDARYLIHVRGSLTPVVIRMERT